MTMNDMIRTEGQSMVSRCDATACRHNSNMECHAGQIEVQMVGDEQGQMMAHCMTFAPEQGSSMSDQPAASGNH